MPFEVMSLVIVTSRTTAERGSHKLSPMRYPSRRFLSDPDHQLQGDRPRSRQRWETESPIDRKNVLPQFRNELLEPLHDGAIFSLNGERVAFSTDSFVVSPIFFPGGDIGKLAVHGTVNDLAMCGARPLYLSAGFILEEGPPMEDFWRVVQSMHAAADSAGVKLVTGDTKVVDRGKADKIFINTSGIGVVAEGVNIHPSAPAPATKLFISGPIAVMASPSCLSGKDWNLKRKSRATPLR